MDTPGASVSPRAPTPRVGRSRRYTPPSRMFYEASRIRKILRRCDMYVVRLLPDPHNNNNSNNNNNSGANRANRASREHPPAGLKPEPTGAQRDTARFGNSRPCVRCLRALDAMGVHRVIFSTGEAAEEGRIGCEVHTVHELLLGCDAGSPGHWSRGDSSQRHLLLPHRPNACLVPTPLLMA